MVQILKSWRRTSEVQPFTKVDLNVNPAEETIRLGPLLVRFLVTGEDSRGGLAAFELVVPGAQRLAVPGHSHDHYEETIYGIDGVLTWTVDGKPIDVSRDRRCPFHAAPFTGSITTTV